MCIGIRNVHCLPTFCHPSCNPLPHIHLYHGFIPNLIPCPGPENHNSFMFMSCDSRVAILQTFYKWYSVYGSPHAVRRFFELESVSRNISIFRWVRTQSLAICDIREQGSPQEQVLFALHTKFYKTICAFGSAALRLAWIARLGNKIAKSVSQSELLLAFYLMMNVLCPFALLCEGGPQTEERKDYRRCRKVPQNPFVLI